MRSFQLSAHALGASLKKIGGKAKHIPLFLRSFLVDKETRSFIRHNKKAWHGWSNRGSDAAILVDFYGVGETLISYSYFLNVLAKKHCATMKSFGAKGWNYALHKVYQSFNTEGHVITSLSGEQECRKEAIVREVAHRLKTKQDVFDLKVLGIWIGIDIYETYLKDGRPTVYLDDPRLIEMVEEGIGLVVFWQEYFAENKVAAVVLSHDCYLNLDIVAKVAYQNHVPVYLPNARGLSLVDRPFAVHAHFPEYRRMFSKLPAEEQASGIAWAKKQLERRFSGEVGVDMPYATKSAFVLSGNEKPALRKSEKTKVLICTHCFYDNPHAYREILFLDFYEWLHYLGGISERTDYDWYLKVHPDPLPGTLETIKGILAKFPRITLIPHETSHQQLVAEGIDSVLTVYGSVGHEYPASGVHVINAGYNPHVAYDFNWHPKSIEEYEYYLLNLDKLQKHINLEELYEFYYMHHYYVPADDLVFKSYRQLLSDLTTEQRIGSAVYGYFLDQLTDAKHQEIINSMQKFIESGKHHYFSHGPE